MLVWIRRADWDALLRRLAECEQQLEQRRRSHEFRSNLSSMMLTKIVPTIAAVAVAYGTLATVFHWNG